MFKIPQHILEDLKCSVCNGYLSSKPLMIKAENEHVCGKCFMIIPAEEKEKCIRQIALESLASAFMFPCRYSKQGCRYTFPWDHEKNHETTCTYRYKTPYRNSTGSDFFRSQLPILNNLKYDMNQNRFPEEYQNLTYLNLQKAIKNDKTGELQNNINLSLEGISLKKPEIIYSDMIEEHIYDSLTPLIKNYSMQQLCFNCKAVIGEQVFSCSLGHISCGNCKGSMCMVCVNLSEKESKTSCKYQPNGCTKILSQEEVNKHQANCFFRNIPCPLEPCKYKNCMKSLEIHLKENHPDKVLFVSELTKTFFGRDETLILLCHNKMFKLVYYYYKSFVEFFITLIGSSEEAADYYYEISMQSDDEFLKRRSKCASWNDSMLEKGITFNRKELVDSNKKKVNFEVQLNIHQIGK